MPWWNYHPTNVHPVGGVPPHLLYVFLPGRIPNPLNESAWGLWKHRRQVKALREKAGMLILHALRTGKIRLPAPGCPKLVHFHRYGHNLMDGDGYQAAVKPLRDALKDMKIIDDDRDSAGHQFVYRQMVSRGKARKTGVELIVWVKEEA